MRMGDFVNWPPTWSTVLLLPALFVAFTVHELAHALVAYLLGDTSQVERKRLSFNPLRHVSWIGMVLFLLFRFGWAKPVWVDPARFRIKNRAFGMFLVSIAGASANLLTGLLAFMGMTATVAIVWTVTGVSPVEVMQFLVVPDPGPDAQGLAVAFSYYMMMVNLLLAVFNLLPFPPLDGFQAVISLFAALRVAFGKRAAAEPVSWGRVPRVAGEEAAGELAERTPAQIHFDIGLDYQKAGEWDEAIARYRQATAHDEQFSLAYYNLGLAYWAKGRASLAVSAFRAAVESDEDLSIRTQAELRLQELARAEQDPEMELGPAPPPFDPGEAAAADADGVSPLDPVVVRRVWLGLGIGGAGLVLLAVGAWLYVTVVTLSEAGGMGLI
jgi:Zn-dependent protease